MNDSGLGSFRQIVLLCGCLLAPSAPAAEPAHAVGPAPELFQKTVDRGVGYLRTHGQAPDGSFSAQSGVGIAVLCTTALLRSGASPEDPTVAKSLKLIEKFVHPDGGIYTHDATSGNYESCLAIVCLTEANRDHRYDKLIQRAEAFVKGAQWDETAGKSRTDLNYGGAGYGRAKRPDLSNTSFLMDALQACGRGPDDPAVRKALVFVSRCQNLESEHNTTPFAAKNPDGGFYYTCAAGGSSPAGETPDGGLRSYASMTYAGLKSMLYAGVNRDDPRVKAATTWIRKHYDLQSNPGLSNAGLYYYYNVFAKTLEALGTDEFVDDAGVKHDWRKELTEELARRQQPDGSWLNENPRWLEADPNLVTGYALMCLSYCRPRPESPAAAH
jgi:squalene-hopene/tetraprenyl-beta-curcumene cyclase